MSSSSRASSRRRSLGKQSAAKSRRADYLSAIDQVRQVGLAQPVVAQHAERLVEDVGDVVELVRQLAAQVEREAVGGEVAPRRLVGAPDLEAGRVAPDPEQRE